jgi:hypothetical protein
MTSVLFNDRTRLVIGLMGIALFPIASVLYSVGALAMLPCVLLAAASLVLLAIALSSEPRSVVAADRDSRLPGALLLRIRTRFFRYNDETTAPEPYALGTSASRTSQLAPH